VDKQTRATGAFELAEVQLETARRLKPTRPTQGEPQARINRRARVRARRRARERAARRELVASATLDPFHANVLEQLNTALERVPIARAKRARTTSCGRARKLVGARLLDQARITLSRSARRSFQEVCLQARSELADVRDMAQARQAEALRADENDKPSSARDLYAAALERDPSLTEAKQALDGYEQETTSNLDRVVDWLESKPAELEDELVWILPLLGLSAVVGFRGLRWLANRRPSIREKMERLSAGFPLGWMRRTCVLRVRFASFDGGAEDTPQGSDISALILDALSPPQMGGPPFPFDRFVGSGPAQAPAAEATQFLAALPHGKLASGLLTTFRFVFDPPTADITGRVLPVGGRGAGLELAVSAPRRPISYSVTIWERLIDREPGGAGPERWYRLVAPAAAWLRWHLRTYVPGEPAAAPLLREWRVDARYQAALQLSGDPQRAQMLYAQILDEDERHLPAAHNLAVIDLRNQQYQQAVQRLDALRDGLMSSQNLRQRWPTLRMSVIYNLAVAFHYLSEVESDGPYTDPGGRAAELAGTLVQRLAHSLQRPHRDDIEQKLIQAELPSVVMLAAMKVRTDSEQRASAITAALADEWPSTLTRPELASGATGIPAAALVHGYVLRQQVIPTRARYNLACYFTALATPLGNGSGEDQEATDEDRTRLFALALTHLDHALKDGSLVAWARRDPSLESLAEAEPEEFDKSIKRNTTAGEAQPPPEEVPAKSKIRPYPQLRRRLWRSFVDWLEGAGAAGPVAIPPSPLRFEAIVKGPEQDLLIDASAADRPKTEELDRFVEDAEGWPKPAPRRVFLVQRNATLPAAFLGLARNKGVEVYRCLRRHRRAAGACLLIASELNSRPSSTCYWGRCWWDRPT
jgi:hypothetical protein